MSKIKRISDKESFVPILYSDDDLEENLRVANKCIKDKNKIFNSLGINGINFSIGNENTILWIRYLTKDGYLYRNPVNLCRRKDIFIRDLKENFLSLKEIAQKDET